MICSRVMRWSLLLMDLLLRAVQSSRPHYRPPRVGGNWADRSARIFEALLLTSEAPPPDRPQLLDALDPAREPALAGGKSLLPGLPLCLQVVDDQGDVGGLGPAAWLSFRGGIASRALPAGGADSEGVHRPVHITLDEVRLAVVVSMNHCHACHHGGQHVGWHLVKPLDVAPGEEAIHPDQH